MLSNPTPSYSAPQRQPSYSSDPDYTTFADSRYPHSQPPIPFNSDAQNLFPNHQLSTERYHSSSPASSSPSHDAYQMDVPHYHEQNGMLDNLDYSQRRDLVDTNIDYSLFTSQGVAEQQSNHIASQVKPKSSPDVGEPLALPKRKPRREKPRIELAPDQPPTTQGKPRARVYVACVQCRARKIRCDGAKPACHNCSKRATATGECSYDSIPKRRGPDKTPGARQRLSREARESGEGGPVRRRRRRDPSPRSTPEGQSPPQIRFPSESGSDLIALPTTLPLASPVDSDVLHTPVDFVPLYGASAPAYVGSNHHNLLLDDLSSVGLYEKAPIAYDTTFDLTGLIPLPHLDNTSHAYITSLDESTSEEEDYSGVSCEPSLNFTRKIWWDSLLSLYLSPHTNRRQNLTSKQRSLAAQGITADLRFLFSTSNYWFSFFHVPTFNSNYFDPVRRERMQPSLVLALLAMSTFWQSSEAGLGHSGRERALRFRDEAQSALDASFNAGWIDETLAQAAWLLALFEVCAHPLHSSERSNSSLILLDSIIRSLSLTFVDADDPKTTTFSPGDVPAVTDPSRRDWLLSEDDFNPHMPSSNVRTLREPSNEPAGCSCRSMTLISHWRESDDQTPLWTLTPAWNNTWNEAEIRKESCRRLCWSSIILAAGHVSYTTAHKSGILHLFISDPSNFALLFSGEAIAYSPSLSSNLSSKDTIWALHDRSFLLWHSCARMRSDTRATDGVKAQFAVKTWLEADALEAALNRHTCRIERQFIFQAREYIFNTRMCISYEFQRFIPLATANVNGLFHRRKAEEWRREHFIPMMTKIDHNFFAVVTHQATVAERFMTGLHTITGNSKNILARRPFYVFWFMGQISRALGLWECDHTLTVAMDVCKAFLPALDYLTGLWPCPEQRHRYEVLRERLTNACYIAGVTPPPPTNLILSVPLPFE
ncbi:hypothetical protein H0H92_006030 [Tricholoma furcatifolium]|nr:hypothetical protein H0H92_006030 [Tricholoma furcatifolium]